MQVQLEKDRRARVCQKVGKENMIGLELWNSVACHSFVYIDFVSIYSQTDAICAARAGLDFFCTRH